MEHAWSIDGAGMEKQARESPASARNHLNEDRASIRGICMAWLGFRVSTSYSFAWLKGTVDAYFGKNLLTENNSREADPPNEQAEGRPKNRTSTRPCRLGKHGKPFTPQI